MEALGVAANIAGVLGLTGHTISGLAKLTKFIRDVKSAHKNAAALLDAIESVSGTLQEVEELLALLQSRVYYKAVCGLTGQQIAPPSLSALEGHIKACKKHVDEWVEIAEKSDLGSCNGFQAFLQRARVAAKLSDSVDLRQKISADQQQIAISLSVLGRVFDHAEQANVDHLSSQVQELTASHIAFKDTTTKIADENRVSLGNRLEKAITMQFAPVEETLKRNYDEFLAGQSAITHSIRQISASISSIASSISAYEPPIPPGWKDNGSPVRRTSLIYHSFDVANPKEPLIWGCNAVGGIDELWIDHNTCLYCGWKDEYSDSFRKGSHLVETHKFGSCNLGCQYDTAEEMVNHLRFFHSATIKAETVEFLTKKHECGKSFDLRLDTLVTQREGALHYPQYDKDENRWDEQPASSLLTESRISSLLITGGICRHGDVYDSANRISMENLGMYMQDLYTRVYSSTEMTTELGNICYQVASIDEELTLANKPIYLLTSGTPGNIAEKLLGWWCREPESVKDSQFPDPCLSKCYPCSNGLWRTREAALEHLRCEHFQHIQNLPEQQISGWVHKLELWPSRLWRQLLQNAIGSQARVEVWLMGCFVESLANRILLRTGETTKSIYETEDPHWVNVFIKFWSWSLPPTGVHFAPSHGAVDSRDDLATTHRSCTKEAFLVQEGQYDPMAKCLKTD